MRFRMRGSGIPTSASAWEASISDDSTDSGTTSAARATRRRPSAVTSAPSSSGTPARLPLKQWTTFPAAEHDEYVDCLTQALLLLRDKNLLTLPEVEEDEAEEDDYARPKGNPYLK
mgnify:CR=1 FL=1